MAPVRHGQSGARADDQMHTIRASFRDDDPDVRLTQFSDYALRMLMYAAAQPQRLITIEETARVFGISRNHLMKVANLLTQTGYLNAVRGRSGGLSLARRPADIRLGALLRLTEPDFSLVECFGDVTSCSITPTCRLRARLQQALNAFLAQMDTGTLADLILTPGDFQVATPTKVAALRSHATTRSAAAQARIPAPRRRRMR